MTVTMTAPLPFCTMVTSTAMSTRQLLNSSTVSGATKASRMRRDTSSSLSGAPIRTDPCQLRPLEGVPAAGDAMGRGVPGTLDGCESRPRPHELRD